ncbi:MAG: 50S ribosomal protein L11 methyltransferase [Alphaproteobacteria bacterium]|nr:50S ribosomal protein L11 methyltransferase [Alphaproteobacteria bacterium]
MTAFWRVVARLRGAEAALDAAAILDAAAGAVSAFESADGPTEWRVEAYPRGSILTAELELRLALAAASGGGTLVEIGEERLRERDWVAENRLAFPPLRIGRLWIHGSHERAPPPPGAIAIEIDASIAFGTGEHPSTRGCLLAMQQLTARRRFRRPLDIGTGSGILAIAAARLLRRPVLAADIDAASVRLARENVGKNGVAGLVRVRRAPGYRDRTIAAARYDLVCANILARPLARMARDLSRRLAPGGRAVLSGLLLRQEPLVLAAHRGVGMTLERRLVIDGWSTVILRSFRRSGGGRRGRRAR